MFKDGRWESGNRDEVAVSSLSELRSKERVNGTFLDFQKSLSFIFPLQNCEKLIKFVPGDVFSKVEKVFDFRV